MAMQLDGVLISDNFGLLHRQHLLCGLLENKLTTPQWRFLSVYLANLNRHELESTRTLKLSVKEFKSIMEISNSRKSNKEVDNAAGQLLKIKLKLSLDNEGHMTFPLFSQCERKTSGDKSEKIAANPTDLALLLLLGYQKYFFKNEIWIARHLKNINHARMYENIKQYLDAGILVVSVSELRKILGVAQDKYIRWDNLKYRVLNGCQEAIATNTDISFSYENIYRKSKGRRVESIRLIIKKNTGYTDELDLCYLPYIKTEKIAGGVIDDKNCYYEYPVSVLSDDEIYDLVVKDRYAETNNLRSNMVSGTHGDSADKEFTPAELDDIELPDSDFMTDIIYTEEEKAIIEQVEKELGERYEWIATEGYKYLCESCNNEFNKQQIVLLADMINKIFFNNDLPVFDMLAVDIHIFYDILKSAYTELETERNERRKAGKDIDRPYSYMRLLIAKSKKQKVKLNN